MVTNPTAARTTPLPTLLGNRYRVERLLGVGGMGAVYQVRDLLREQFRDPQPCIALKMLNDNFAAHPDANTLLYSEYALTCRLHHPHIIRPYSYHVDAVSKRAFLTMELLDGPTLDQVIADHPHGLAWPQLRSLGLSLLSALTHAHAAGVLHGDLKPGNVLLASAGLRLFDFGLGQGCTANLQQLPRLSRQLAAWTPRYAALELLDGAELSRASDLYAVACLLYELASGHHPFSRLTARQALRMQQDRTLQKPGNMPTKVWRELRTALAFEPAQRTTSVEALMRAFRQGGRRGWPASIRWGVRPATPVADNSE
ncbi:MAG: serine/threonine-protein kinase [Pseudomonadaceae bacterium]